MKTREYGVIFDLDGLLADTEPIYFEAMNTIASKHGKEFTMELKKQVMGKAGILSMRLLKDSLGLPESVEEMLIERAKLCKGIANSKGIKAMPGAFKTIDMVDNAGFKKAIASSSHKKWVKLVLEKLEIYNRFDVVITGDDVALGKPSPDVFLVAAKKLGLKNGQCIILEDTVVGVEAAKKANIKCIAIPNKYNSEMDFSGATLVIKSLENLDEAIIKKLLI